MNSFEITKNKHSESFWKAESFWFTYDELLDSNFFYEYIVKNMQAKTQYCVLLKVRYDSDNFAMLGSQIPFKFDDYSSNDTFNNFKSDIISRLNSILDKYGLDFDELNLIQLIYKEVSYGYLEKLKLEEIKDKVSKKEYHHIKKLSRYLPLSFDHVYYGKPLKVKCNKNIVNSVLTLTKDESGNYIDFIDKFNLNNNILDEKVRLPNFNSNQLFFQNTIKDVHYIVVIQNIDKNKMVKEAYTLNGTLIDKVEDTNCLDNCYIRKYGSYILLIKNNEITFIEQDIKLTSIKKPIYHDKGNIIENTRIGVLDLETYNVDVNKAKVYALGFYTNLDAEPVLYYIDKDNLNSDEIVINCINEMLRPKYKGITFYVHNLGKFDSIFIISTLLRYNYLNKSDYYKIETVRRDAVILKLKIKCESNSITILDSYRILTDKLKKLAVKYEVEVTKGDFPYKFALSDNLFYIGQTPSINFYPTSICKEEYKLHFKELWDFKKESLVYLSKDLISLYQILVKVNKTLFLDFDIDMTKCLTISKLAYEIFTKDYLSKEKPIPLIKKKAIYKDIKAGYFGGMTEVYKPYGKDLYYYDVNSLYPYVGLNDMVGTKCKKIEYIFGSTDIDNLFGFFHCEIETPNTYLGLLPVRTKTGNIFPLGKWSGMYFSEELKFAKENGYKINVKWGYKFNRVTNVFSDYVNNLYSKKSNPNNITQKLLAKSLLNNLFGRFGMDIEKFITKIVDNENFNEIKLTRKISSMDNITDDDILLTYSPELDESTCEKFGIDYIKALKDPKIAPTDKCNSFQGVSIPIAAAITAYGRIHINKIKIKILNNKGNIYYSDTDSIVTDIELPVDMVDPKSIGKLKLEHKVKVGYFISNKTYCLVTKDGKIITRAKGVKQETLDPVDYISMYFGNDLNEIIKLQSTTNHSEGSVVISEKKIKLSASNYTKRTKVYNNDLWVDTKCLVVNS